MPPPTADAQYTPGSAVVQQGFEKTAQGCTAANMLTSRCVVLACKKA